jgi:hypothetical protein
MADGMEAPRARESVQPAHGLVCTLSNCPRGGTGSFVQVERAGHTGCVYGGGC